MKVIPTVETDDGVVGEQGSLEIVGLLSQLFAKSDPSPVCPE